nr:hypothetical protein [uncultured Actinoplanes sp.]
MTIDEIALSGQEADVPTTTSAQRSVNLVARLATALKAALLPAAAAAEQPPPDGVPVDHRRQDALAVLTAARGVVRRGWVQRTWYALDTPAGRRHVRQRFLPGRLDHRQVAGACLVGAVIHAAWQQSPRSEHAYPAIDALWHALFDVGPAGDAAGRPGDPDPVGPMAPPLVRAARVRDLTTWNDREHRTRDDVLRLLDRAAARVAAPRPSVSG